MKVIAIAVLIVLIPAASPLAQNRSTASKPEPATGKPASKTQPVAIPSAQGHTRAKACAEYGAGFVPIAGTGTCVKIGGYVRMQDTAR
jgi:hypothetical protein